MLSLAISDEIFSKGAAFRTITGQLNFLPGHLAELYDYRGVPKMYLQVKDVSLPGLGIPEYAEALNIRVAASFTSAFEGSPKTYATYASFNPAVPGELSAAVEWMQDEYVDKEYGGRIITDFDEITPRFNHAPFSLSRVMGRSLDLTGLQEAGLEHMASFILKNQRELNLTIQIQKQQMDTTNFNISGGNIMNLGKEVHVNAPQQQVNQADIDVQALCAELAKLLEAASSASDAGVHASEVQAVASAEEAAKKGDKTGAIQHLKSAGKWVFDMASKIGATLAAAVIKQHMGW